jgi:uridine kinase
MSIWKLEALFEYLAQNIAQMRRSYPLRIAVDGVDASGKTCFADGLASVLKGKQCVVIRASVDGFHNPKSIRRQRGDLSPEGFYHDSYNYPALIHNLLKPLGPGGSLEYRTQVFDVEKDEPIDSPLRTTSGDAILLMDGIFLLRPELLPFWDLKIFLQADFKNTVQRGAARDASLYGSRQTAEERYWERYVPGQELYLRLADPVDNADILIDNNDLESPNLLTSLKIFENYGDHR